ncbi:hypothetical protein PLEOSDRAFT_159284 [Pleurotus ostreatus PC15]|uniref:Uncharacterized protein n=1 Tax=Pleurotus ostreatus (strain PC15) TaxID=1137138 RepID=A0A067NFJ4_PLEO1|nr:hypothetical protein PLEOSDRAFT_159284 [Pleurotus ostreatus PC15]
MLKVIKASEIKLAESWAYRGTLIQSPYNSCAAFRSERAAKFAEDQSLPGGFKDSTQN